MRIDRNIILILSALAVCSCGWNEIVSDEGPDVPIGFNWYTLSGRQATKADADHFVGGLDGTAAERHLNAGTSFGVFGYFHPQPDPNPDPKTAGGWKHGAGIYNAPNLFYNEPVTISYNDATQKYSYGYTNDRFWPKNIYDRISFFAYYPYYDVINEENEAGLTVKATVEPILDTRKEREGLVAFYHTTPANPADHVDFMVSDLCLDQSRELWKSNHSQGLTIGNETSVTADQTGTVKFFFHHALSQIRIRPLVSDYNNPNVTVSLKSARFVNVKVRGRCIPVADYANTTSAGRTPVTLTWPEEYLSTMRPGELEATGMATDACFDAQGNLSHPENILLMIPQAFPDDDPAIEVKVDVVRWKDGVVVNGEVTDANAYLEDGVTPNPSKFEYYYPGNVYHVPLSTGVSAWLPGKIYTYSVSVSLTAIKVTAVEEVDWLTASDDVFLDPVVTPEP